MFAYFIILEINVLTTKIMSATKKMNELYWTVARFLEVSEFIYNED